MSLRYALHGDPEHPFSEAIGIVQSVGPDEGGSMSLNVVDRKGETKLIALEDILAAKLFP